EFVQYRTNIPDRDCGWLNPLLWYHSLCSTASISIRYVGTVLDKLMPSISTYTLLLHLHQFDDKSQSGC
ncbi:MAG: hypothetical protein AAF438_22445, partial [Pseudomonadota bacterium]